MRRGQDLKAGRNGQGDRLVGHDALNLDPAGVGVVDGELDSCVYEAVCLRATDADVSTFVDGRFDA
jgi:hypothetical protein